MQVWQKLNDEDGAEMTSRPLNMVLQFLHQGTVLSELYKDKIYNHWTDSQQLIDFILVVLLWIMCHLPEEGILHHRVSLGYKTSFRGLNSLKLKQPSRGRRIHTNGRTEYETRCLHRHHLSVCHISLSWTFPGEPCDSSPAFPQAPPFTPHSLLGAVPCLSVSHYPFLLDVLR